MTNTETRAQDFINKAAALELSDADLHIVLDDLLDVDHYDRDNVLGVAMNDLHNFGLTLFESDDDYDDFAREVRGVLAGDDACEDCGYDLDGDCFCEEDDFEADPIDLQDEAEGRF